MKKPLLLLFLSISSTLTFSQTYKDKAAAIQKEVMADAGPEFALKDVPAEYANESAIILAQSHKTLRTSNSKLKIGLMVGALVKSFINVNTFHERVKINDKAALDDYSTINYQKQLDNSMSFNLIKIKSTHETYVGAKILKPNGKEVIINTSEEVLLKDKAKDKQGKLAIPDLQVGDILDYYVWDNDMDEDIGSENVSNNQIIFMQVAEYPILNYSLDLQISKKFDMQSIAANGAKLLSEKPATADDRFYTLKIKNIPKFQNQIWTSPYRQNPYIEIYTTFTSKKPSTRLSFIIDQFKSKFNERYTGVFDLSGEIKKHFDGRKGAKAAPLDSTLNVVYNLVKYHVFGDYSSVAAEDAGDLNYRRANSMYVTARVSMQLTNLDIDHEVLLVSSRFNSSLENAFTENDLVELIRVNSNGRYVYMCFYDPLLQFNEIPAQFQGEKAFVYKTKRNNGYSKYDFTERPTAVLPITSAAQNVWEEQLTVTLPAANMLSVQVNRNVKQTGYLRFDGQRAFVNARDVDKQMMDFAKGDELVKRVKENVSNKKIADGVMAAMVKTPAELKKLFTDEIKSQFDQEPKALADFKILNTGLADLAPFQYSSSFALDNMVKKAGNNYILDAGKLSGTFMKLEAKDRKRNIDIYMQGARTFKYAIAINIPKGYRVKGIESMNRSKSNQTGSFASTATLNGNVLNISVSRAYNHAFEKAADWPQLVEIIDAASEYNDQKILLEKEG